METLSCALRSDHMHFKWIPGKAGMSSLTMSASSEFQKGLGTLTETTSTSSFYWDEFPASWEIVSPFL